MRQLKYTYWLLAAALVLLAAASCQKVINLKLNNAAAQLVIEGNVTNNIGRQYVTLSQSVPFSATNNFPPVSGATVTITDDAGNIYFLKEGMPGSYSTGRLNGTPGITYTLSVKTGGQTYTATSTMPYPVNLDSLTDKINTFNSGLRTVTVNYRDPAVVANQYRFILYVNNNQSGLVFTNDDSFTNGRYVREDLFENDVDIHPGDTVAVDMQCIDEKIYKYWFSLSQQQGNGPGAGVTPSNPPSNISNNALGYFSAHTTQQVKLLVY